MIRWISRTAAKAVSPASRATIHHPSAAGVVAISSRAPSAMLIARVRVSCARGMAATSSMSSSKRVVSREIKTRPAESTTSMATPARSSDRSRKSAIGSRSVTPLITPNGVPPSGASMRTASSKAMAPADSSYAGSS